MATCGTSNARRGARHNNNWRGNINFNYFFYSLAARVRITIFGRTTRHDDAGRAVFAVHAVPYFPHNLFRRFFRVFHSTFSFAVRGSVHTMFTDVRAKSPLPRARVVTSGKRRYTSGVSVEKTLRTDTVATGGAISLLPRGATRENFFTKSNRTKIIEYRQNFERNN